MPIDKNLMDMIIGQHPARKMGFDELYDGLLENAEKGFITKKSNNGLELFNYTPISLYNYIKPKGNELPGYEPSKAINRFQKEASQG